VASVLGALLAGIVLQILSAQSRFVDYQEARGEVQENTRSVRELIVGELRSVPPSGIESASLNAVTLRVPRVWGIVCAAGVGSIDVVVPGGLGTSFAVGAAATRPGLAVQSGGGWSSWTVTDVPSAGAGASADCTSAAAGAAEIKRVALEGAGSIPAVSPGAAAYLFDRISYATGTSTSAPGVWIRRRIGTADFQALAGPIASGTPEQTGLRFRYHSETGPLTLASVAADPGQVRRVDVIVHSISRGSFAGQPQAEVDSTSVFLRSSA
jgi:hypothetical protein